MITANTETTDPQSTEKLLRSILSDLKAEEKEKMLSVFSRSESASAELMQDPQTGLIMVTATDSFQEPFHLGEMLVCTAEVEYRGIRAHATTMGDDPRCAVLAATVNAYCRSGENNNTVFVEFCRELDRAACRVLQARELEKKFTAATKVSFDSMAPEEM